MEPIDNSTAWCHVTVQHVGGGKDGRKHHQDAPASRLSTGQYSPDVLQQEYRLREENQRLQQALQELQLDVCAKDFQLQDIGARHQQQLAAQQQDFERKLAAAHQQQQQQQQQMRVMQQEREGELLQWFEDRSRNWDVQAQIMRAQAELQLQQAAEESANLAALQAELTQERDQLREALQQLQQDTSSSMAEQGAALQKELVAAAKEMVEEREKNQTTKDDLKLARRKAKLQENLASKLEQHLREAERQLLQQRERCAQLAHTLAGSMNILLQEKTGKVLKHFEPSGQAAGKGINGVVERGTAELYPKGDPNPDETWTAVDAVCKHWTPECAEEGVYQLLLTWKDIKRAAKDPSCSQAPKLLGFQARGADLYMVLEDCGMSLADLLRDTATSKVQLGPKQWLDIVQQILRHVDELHSRGWAHIDLKPDNILVRLTRMAEGLMKVVVKLCDFSHSINSAADAAEVQRDGPMVGGTPTYTSPLIHANYPGVKALVELLRQHGCLEMSTLPENILQVLSEAPSALTLEQLQQGDRFAAAVIIWEVLTGTRLHDQPGYLLTCDGWSKAMGMFQYDTRMATRWELLRDQSAKLVNPGLAVVNRGTLLRYLPRASQGQQQASTSLADKLAVTLRQLGEGEGVAELLGAVQRLQAILG